MKKKSKRPISRFFWSFLRYLPGPLRTGFIRSQFEVSNDIPPNVIFKQAESEEEIFQALNIVYESFLELNYIDSNEHRLRFNKFLALPNTVILIAKQDDIVLGTISIIPDSHFGLPSEITWPLDKYRQSGKLIAEISSLAIRKDFKLRRGKFLFYLCKIMYLYAKNFLNLDGIVIATTHEVEPFYTDILLFDKVSKTTGQEHSLVKGNPSTCCFLDLETAEQRYKKIYNRKPDKRNLYKFFVEKKDLNIVLPKKQTNIMSYTREKNLAQNKIFKKYKSLLNNLSVDDVRVLKSSDQFSLYNSLPKSSDHSIPLIKDRLRIEVRSSAWLFIKNVDRPLKCKVIDVSSGGVKVLLKEAFESFLNEISKASIAINVDNLTVMCNMEIIWRSPDQIFGARIINPPADWCVIVEKLISEFSSHSEDNFESNKAKRFAG